MPNPTGINQYTRGAGSHQIPGSRPGTRSSAAQLMKVPEGITQRTAGALVRAHKNFVLARQHDPFMPGLTYVTQQRVGPAPKKGLVASIKSLFKHDKPHPPVRIEYHP